MSPSPVSVSGSEASSCSTAGPRRLTVLPVVTRLPSSVVSAGWFVVISSATRRAGASTSCTSSRTAGSCSRRVSVMPRNEAASSRSLPPEEPSSSRLPRSTLRISSVCPAAVSSSVLVLSRIRTSSSAPPPSPVASASAIVPMSSAGRSSATARTRASSASSSTGRRVSPAVTTSPGDRYGGSSDDGRRSSRTMAIGVSIVTTAVSSSDTRVPGSSATSTATPAPSPSIRTSVTSPTSTPR